MVVLHPDNGLEDISSAEQNVEDMKEEFKNWEPTYDYCRYAFNTSLTSPFPPSVKKLISLIPSTSHWRLMEHSSLGSWLHDDGAVVLLGDACHPMLVRPVLLAYCKKSLT